MTIQRILITVAMATSFLAGCSGDNGDGNVGDDGDAASAQDATGGGDGNAPSVDAALADHTAPDGAAASDSSAIDAGAHDSSTATDSAMLDSSAPDSSPDSSAPDASDAAVECSAPATLHPSGLDAGPYCPFSTAVPPFATCASGQHCCEPPEGLGTLSTCAGDCSSLADGGTDWQCQDPVSCPSGQLCCAVATSFDPNPTCGYGLLHSFRATVCAASCGAGQLRVCESDVECPSNTTCKVVKAKGANFGVCQ